MNGNRKRSVIIENKRTSVCLEDSFWLSLHAIVRMEQTTIEGFIETVKRSSDPRNLSSSLRVAILEYFQRIAVRDKGIDGQIDLLLAASGEDPMPQESRRELREKVVAFWSGVHGHEAHYSK